QRLSMRYIAWVSVGGRIGHSSCRLGVFSLPDAWRRSVAAPGAPAQPARLGAPPRLARVIWCKHAECEVDTVALSTQLVVNGHSERPERGIVTGRRAVPALGSHP